jgi:hypothetical protein
MPSCGPICPAVSSQKPFTSDRYIEYIEYRERELCMCAFVRASTNDMPYSFNVPDYLGCISEPILNPQCLLVSKAPVMHEYKMLKAYFQQNVIIEHINMLTDWRKLSCCTAPNGQVLLTESRASLSWDLCKFRGMAEGDCPATLSHPSSSDTVKRWNQLYWNKWSHKVGKLNTESLH